MKNLKKYSINERVHNIEELIWSLFLVIGLIGIITVYKSPFLWVNIILISALTIVFGIFSVRFLILTEITGNYWENATSVFIEHKKEKIIVWVKWISMVSAIIVSKYLMNYDWKATTGILILTIVGNLATNGWLNKK